MTINDTCVVNYDAESSRPLQGQVYLLGVPFHLRSHLTARCNVVTTMIVEIMHPQTPSHRFTWIIKPCPTWGHVQYSVCICQRCECNFGSLSQGTAKCLSIS